MLYDENVFTSPAAGALAELLRDFFADAIERFENNWHAGWDKPANESACVASVAGDVAVKTNRSVAAWCEVYQSVLCHTKDLTPPNGILRGAVDLVCCDARNGQILALIEFKTHSSVQKEIKKLETLQVQLQVPTIVIVGSQDVDDSETEAIEMLNAWVTTGVEWHRIARKGVIHLNPGNRDLHLVHFALWRTQ